MIERVPASKLALQLAPVALPGPSTESMSEEQVATFGQERAAAAIWRALNIRQPDHHLFAVGPPGTGKTMLVEEMARKLAGGRPAPDDLLVANRFDDPTSLHILHVPAGKGADIARRLDKALDELEKSLNTAINHRAHRAVRMSILHAAVDRRRDALFLVEEAAKQLGYGVDDDGNMLTIVPLDTDGGLMRPEEVERLDELRRRKLEAAERELRDVFTEFMERQQELQEELDRDLSAADNKAAARVIRPVFTKLRRKFRGMTSLLDWLKEAQDKLLEDWSEFTPQPVEGLFERIKTTADTAPKDQYLLHLLVTHDPKAGAPVVIDWHPTFYSLIGRLERRFAQGVMETSAALMRAGTLMQASGGFLLLPARELLRAPLAWPALKRVLRERQVKIHDPEDWVGGLPLSTLHPEPVPLDLKIILIGSLEEYVILRELDSDFSRYFKVRADFGVVQPLKDEALMSLAGWAAAICNSRSLCHLDPSGVAALAEHSSRLAGSQDELTLQLQPLVDLLVEADQDARVAEQELITREVIERVVEDRRQRENLYHDMVLDDYRRQIMLVDLHGERLGQVNGLALTELGDIVHALPIRITARTYAGRDGIVNIERETDLSGRIHSKAVLILTGYLGGLFAKRRGLAMSASITFEQTYDIVEGDSASVAELIALLSSLSGLPARQDLAITGSMSQHGEVQAVGGLNEKIEGFFDVCSAQGLTGTQGVVMPRSILSDLNLARRVREAVEQERFHIYAIDHVDDALELFLGRPAGKPRRDGNWPARSVLGRAAARLARLGEAEDYKDSKEEDQQEQRPPRASKAAEEAPQIIGDERPENKC